MVIIHPLATHLIGSIFHLQDDSNKDELLQGSASCHSFTFHTHDCAQHGPSELLGNPTALPGPCTLSFS